MKSGEKTNPNKWIIPLIALICLGVDAITKELARNELVPGEPVAFIPGVMRFFVTHNTGAAFSLGAGNSYLMTALASLVTLALVAWMLKRESTLVSNLERVGLGFLFGGACGNLLDRFTLGRVTDFMEFTFVVFPVFNCADVCIDIGIGLILIAMMQENSVRKEKSEEEETAKQEEGAAQHDYHG